MRSLLIYLGFQGVIKTIMVGVTLIMVFYYPGQAVSATILSAFITVIIIKVVDLWNMLHN